ncbi:MAG: hypothetical protein AAF791_10755 [Bacteroidota bacterium]
MRSRLGAEADEAEADEAEADEAEADATEAVKRARWRLGAASR